MTNKKTTLIRIFSLILLLITSLSIFCSCDFELPEQPEAYYEDIYVVVTDIEKNSIMQELLYEKLHLRYTAKNII